MNRRLISAAIASLTLLACPVLAEGQNFPAFGGVEARLGGAAPENADLGPSVSLDLDLGSIGIGSLRTLAGFHLFRADRNVEGFADPGSYTATGGRLGLRLDLFGTWQLTPYLIGAVTGHNVSVDVADPQTAQLLEGFYAGASVGAGVAYAFDAAGSLALTAEARRTLASNIGHYAFEAGVRWLPRGAASYRRAPVGVEGLAALERERLEAERRRLAEAQTAAERERAERERLAAERAREEQERLARMTEEERRRAGQQVAQAEQQTELARRQAEAAEQARQAEAAARTQAERAADEAAERAREAEQRAAEAERRLYDSLLELERLIANVTGIRETDRGLAVVVGQGLFASGQSSLSARAREEVARIAAVLRQFADNRISVEGHTDSVGSEVSNQRLSEQRAESVRAALIAEGVDPGRVDGVGFGQNQPIASNDTAAGRAENRRVEIVIVGARRPTGR
jgi:outer membrane protein OmpA-like peptidoglycan-associated protein